jgi:hypothetical protein
MQTVEIFKATPIWDEKASSVTILIDDEFPECYTLTASRALHAEQAKKLADVLWKSLPGGTIDALMVELMSRKVALFRVPFPPVDEAVQS